MKSSYIWPSGMPSNETLIRSKNTKFLWPVDHEAVFQIGYFYSLSCHNAVADILVVKFLNHEILMKNLMKTGSSNK